MKHDLKEISSHFNIYGDFIIAVPYGTGHINDTYITDDGKYILQRINVGVFNDPKGLTDNIVLITGYLKTWLAAHGGDPERETLTPIPAKDDAWYIQTEEGECFRLYKIIANTVSYDSATPELLYHLGLRLTVRVSLSPWVSPRRAKKEPVIPQAPCALID